MSIEWNKRIVRRVYDELINGEDKAVVDEIYAQDVIIHDPFMGTVQGREAFHQLLGMFDAGFPHHRVTVDAMTAEDDLVCVLHTHHATHAGNFMGVPPTHKSIEVSGIELIRVKDGKIAEFWRKDDDVSLLMQLGVLPEPQPA